MADIFPVSPGAEPSQFESFTDWIAANPVLTLFIAGAGFLVLFGSPKGVTFHGRMNPLSGGARLLPARYRR